jgi:hypothetical protein
MKTDLKTETEKLIQRFDRENQKLSNQLTRKLDSEIRSVITSLVRLAKCREK